MKECTMILSNKEIDTIINGLCDVEPETWKKITEKGAWYKFFDEFEKSKDTMKNFYIKRGQLGEAFINAWMYTNGPIVHEFFDTGVIKPKIDTNYKSNYGHSLADGIRLLKNGTLQIISSKIKDDKSLGLTESDISELCLIASKICKKFPDEIKKVELYVISASDWSTTAKKRINKLILNEEKYYLKTVLLDEKDEGDNFNNEKHEYLYMKDIVRKIGLFLNDYNYKFPKYDKIHHNRNVLSPTQNDKLNELLKKFKTGISQDILYNAGCRDGKTCVAISLIDKLNFLNKGDTIVMFGNFPGNNDQMIKKFTDYDENINCGVCKPTKDDDTFVYNSNMKNVVLLSAQMVHVNDDGKITIKQCVQNIIKLKPTFIIIDEAHYGIGSESQLSFLAANFKCSKIYLTGTANISHLNDLDRVTLNDVDIYTNMATDSETYLDKNKHKRSVKLIVKMPDDFDVANLEADVAQLSDGSYNKTDIENGRYKSISTLFSQIFSTVDITDNMNVINNEFKNQRTGKGILKNQETLVEAQSCLMMVHNKKSQDIWEEVINKYNKNYKEENGSDYVEVLKLNSEITPGSSAIILANDFINTPSNKKKIILVVKQCLIGCDFSYNLDGVINWTHRSDCMSLTKQQGLNRSKTPIGKNKNPVSIYFTPYSWEVYRIAQEEVYSMTHNGDNSIPEEIAEKLSISSIVYRLFDTEKPSVEDMSATYKKMLKILFQYETALSFNVSQYKIRSYLDDKKYDIEDIDIDNTGCKMPYIRDKETGELVTDSNGNPIPMERVRIESCGKIWSVDDARAKHKENCVVKLATGRFIKNPKFSKETEKKIEDVANDLNKDNTYKHQFKQQIVFEYTLNALMAYLMCYILFNESKGVIKCPTVNTLVQMVNDDPDLFDWFFENKAYKKAFKTMESIIDFLDVVYGVNNIDNIIEKWYNGIIQNRYIRIWVMNNKVYKKKFGEVLTPKSMVNKMIEHIPEDDFKDMNKTFIDNSYGTGNFLIGIIKKCMKFQEDNFATQEERFEWIIKNRIFGVELQERNVKLSLYRNVYDEDDEEYDKTFNPTLNYNNWWVESGHCVCTDALTFDYWNGTKFDNVVGNPPYNKPRFKKKDGSDVLWDKFVFKAFEILKSNGRLTYIHPIGWRQYNSSTGLWELMTSKDILYIKNITESECSKIFEDVGQRIDYYHLVNRPYQHKTTIDDNYGNVFECDLTQYPFLTSESFNLIIKYLAKPGEETAKIIKPKLIRDDGGDIELISAVTVDENDIRYGRTSKNNGYGIPKVIFPENGRKGRFKDADGRYSIGQYCFAIECDSADADAFYEYSKSDEMNNIIEALRWSVLHCKYQVFTLFKKDWWKNRNNTNA